MTRDETDVQAWPRLIHHGGATGVTGSCHQLFFEAERTGAARPRSLLVDCGLFQGRDQAEDAFAQLQVRFDLSGVCALLVTHVHIDHVGRLPYLLAAGFGGPIVCTRASAQLLPLVLEDALKVGFTRDAALIRRVLGRIEQQVQAVDYGDWLTLIDDREARVRVCFEPAGHILGSAYVRCSLLDRLQGRRSRVLFSGDLGPPHTPLLPAPKPAYGADVLVLESTYGDRLHVGRRTRRRLLADTIEQALGNGGTVIVPAFSIGRTQELLYEIEGIIQQRQGLWRDLAIIVDSPLAARFTRVYRQLQPLWDAEAQLRLRRGRHPLAFDTLQTIGDHAAHLRVVRELAESGRPAVVIAAGGMAAGGRVVDYLKAMLPDPRHHVLFVGYQAEGTPGRAIQRYGPTGGWVELDGQRTPIRAGVVSLTGYSAHADQSDLVGFVRRMRHWPERIHLVHGEEPARLALREALLAMATERQRRFSVIA